MRALMATFLLAATLIGRAHAEAPPSFVMRPRFIDAAGPRAQAFAVWLTGDGGFAAFDRRVCSDLARGGLPVLAVDTSDYFRTLREPREAARALAGALDQGVARWGATRVVLIGYSFGADVAPFLVNQLPATMKTAVDRIALLAPSGVAAFQVTLKERIGLDKPGGRAVRPQIETALQDGRRFICLYGAHDGDALCPSLAARDVKSIALPGGHTFNGDDVRVADAILDRGLRRTAGLP